MVQNSFLPGTHAYLINRRVAIALSSLSGPIWLAADALFMSFSDSMQHYGLFRIARVRFSEIGQLPTDGTNNSDVQK